MSETLRSWLNMNFLYERRSSNFRAAVVALIVCREYFPAVRGIVFEVVNIRRRSIVYLRITLCRRQVRRQVFGIPELLFNFVIRGFEAAFMSC